MALVSCTRSRIEWRIGWQRHRGHCTFQVPSMAAAAIQVLRDRDARPPEGSGWLVGGRPIWIAEDNKAQGVAPLAVPQMAQLTQLAPMTQLLQMSQMSQLAPFLPLLQQQVVQAVQPELNVPTAASGSRIFFSNVPFDVQELQLQQVFQSIGPIVELNLMRTPDGKSRGMGHCTYATPDLAAAAIQYLLDRDVGGRPLLVKQVGS
ncbi:unnamed protein product [Effrenium voratum]|nr:unnamed protein product [Effrenium voratum]